MKKICIVNLNIYCLFDSESSAPMGGAELDMYTLAKGLENKLKVSIITGNWGQKKIEAFGNIKVFRSSKLKSKGLFSIIKESLLFLLTLIKTNADIYISSGASPEIGVISLFCLLKRKKFIYRTAHEIDCNGQYIQLHGLKGLLYKYGLEHAWRVVTSVKQHQILLNVNHPNISEQIQHINLGIFLNNKNNLGNKKDGYILWVARCEKWKNPELFLYLAESFSQYKFIMICPQQNHNKEYFYTIKQKATLLPNITFIDFVPFKNIQDYFNKAKLFINTSNYEGFTYTLIQSGVAKTPVIYFNVNPDQVITKHNIGYVSDGNKKKMAEQIRTLLNNDKVWNEKSKNIFQYVKENHDINIVGRQWEKLLEKI